MVRVVGLLVLAGVALVIWILKNAFGAQSGTLDHEIKTTVRKTSSWIDGLKEEWDKAKKK